MDLSITPPEKFASASSPLFFASHPRQRVDYYYLPYGDGQNETLFPWAAMVQRSGGPKRLQVDDLSEQRSDSVRVALQLSEDQQHEQRRWMIILPATWACLTPMFDASIVPFYA